MTLRARVVAVLAAAVGLSLVAAPPALAHGGPPTPDAAYYATAITAVTPPLPGVVAQVARNGDWLQLTDARTTDVVVLGYGQEPYLRITADGVWQNDLSPTVYLNQSLFADTSQGGAGTSASVAPAWRRTGTTGTARWHDHRIHWMGPGLPPRVAADPTRAQLIGSWSVPATAGGTSFEIRGTLSWTGRPAAGRSMPGIVLIGLVLAAVWLVALTALAFRGRRERPGAGSADRPERGAPMAGAGSGRDVSAAGRRPVP
jgi:hypothetical protein